MPRGLSFRLCMSALVLAAGLTWTGPSAASDVSPFAEAAAVAAPDRHVSDTGAAERVLAATRLRTLAMELPAAACHLNAGLLPDAAHARLRAGRNEMRRLLNALEFGDARLGIHGAEDRSGTIRDIHAVRVLWAPMKEHVNQLLHTPGATAAREGLRAFEDVFEEYAGVTVSTVAGQYAHPFELTQANAVMLDLVTRQALHTQRIAKLACEAAETDTSENTVAALQEARDRVALGLEVLRSGHPALGVGPAPTEAIAHRLDHVRAQMRSIDTSLDRIAQNTANAEDRARVADVLSTASDEMGHIATLYGQHSKHLY